MKISSRERVYSLLKQEKELIQRIQSTKASWCIFGGTAVNIYGGSRDIKDIDILIDLYEFKIADFCDISIPEKSCITSLNKDIEVWANPLSFEKDKIYQLFFDKEMKERINYFQIKEFSLPIISVEDLIVMKMILNRNEKEGKYDNFDINELVVQNNKNYVLDIEYILFRVQKIGAENLLNDRLKILGGVNSNGNS